MSAGISSTAKENRGAERNVGLPAKFDFVAQRVVAGLELAHFVELAVVGQIGLRHHAEDASAIDDHRAVVEQMVDFERHADRRDDRPGRRRREDFTESLAASVEQRTLMKQVVAGVAEQPEFREEDDDRLAIDRLAHQREGLIRVVGGVGDAHRRDAHGDAHDVVVVEVEEFLSRFHVTAYSGNFDAPRRLALVAAIPDAAAPISMLQLSALSSQPDAAVAPLAAFLFDSC